MAGSNTRTAAGRARRRVLINRRQTVGLQRAAAVRNARVTSAPVDGAADTVEAAGLTEAVEALAGEASVAAEGSGGRAVASE